MAGEATATADVARRTRRRVTRRLMPFLIVAYLVAYLDRANVGVAKLQMQGSLGFTDATVGFGAGIFFLGYFLLEIPSALIVEHWSARKWISRIMVSWGLVAMLTGLIGTSVFNRFSLPHQFFGMRFLLGAAEAGFFPGVIVYFSHWFRGEDRARAQAYFMVTQPIAVVVGVPASRWILENIHWGGLDGWRWVFLLEGLPAVLLGIATLFYLTDRPHQARWLPEDEKRWLEAELDREHGERAAAGRVRTLEAFRQPRTLLLMTVYFLIVTGNQGLIFFLPSVTDEMKSMSVAARTAVATAPYAFGIIGILWNGFSAHRTGERRWHTAVPMLSTGACLAFAMLAGGRLPLEIAFLCLAGFGSQAYLPVFWTLPTAFLGKSAAAAAVGTINSFGNLGGFAGPYVFGSLKTATGSFAAGMWFLAAFTFAAGLLATAIRTKRR